MAIKTVFFDAVGTLIRLRHPVGEVYANVALQHGLNIDAQAKDQAFRAVWRQSPSPVHPSGQLPGDDDRSWWRDLVARSFDQVLGRTLAAAEMDSIFTQIYDHFAGPAAWLVYDDVRPTLEALQGRCRLLVLSNFDQRLKGILAGHGLARYFAGMIISSETGASKPHPRMFEAALQMANASPEECLHVGDDAKADIEGARQAGMTAYHVTRPEQGLEGVLRLIS